MEHADAFILEKFGANGPISHLEVLSVRQTYTSGRYVHNSDADFLGIFQIEVDMLGKMGPEALKHLQVVPIKPAITTAKRKAF